MHRASAARSLVPATRPPARCTEWHCSRVDRPAFEAPAELQRTWEALEVELPPNFAASDDARREQFVLDRKRYYAMVANLDAKVGRMTAFLERERLADDTAVVLLSDHEELGGSHGLRAKHWPYEESVGLSAHHPRPRPSRSSRAGTFPTSTEDWFPTLLGLAGLAPQNPVQGWT